jgi:2-polyprenyl-6-methoxyphenol hydroxylase-like FAD-dependent oxidoreductase
MAIETPVLIVGGSLNGLTTALCLAHHGVACMLVERHPATTVQYKFRGISPRSMEIFRSLGVADAVRARDSADQSHEIARVRNLADLNVQWTGLAWPDPSAISPTRPATVDQDRLEPILRERAASLGADIRFNTEMLDFEQDDHGVRARIRDLTSGAEERVAARYLIAADGTSSATRDALGVARNGPGVQQHWMNIIFETDLQPFLQGRRFTSCFVTDVNGSILPRDSGGNWLLAVQYTPENGESPEQFDAAKCRDLVRQAAGRQDIKADLIDARPWEVAGLVAERFGKGRAFLVGDAAHVMPPTGGFGGNAGIHDAHNLAWKLAFVLNNGVSPNLLDTYDAERRPIADATLAQALARLSAWFKDLGKRLPPPVPIIDEYDVVFGQLYAEGAFVREDNAPPSRFEDPRQPSGRPGSRAPHVPIVRKGETLSTLDLFGQGFVLLSGAEGDPWLRAAEGTAGETGVGIDAYGIGQDIRDVEGLWLQKYGVTGAGAVLVRPDGIVAWRAKGADDAPEAALKAALQRIVRQSPADAP